MAIQVKAGDTGPYVQATLLDADGEPVTLVDATARFLMARRDTQVISVDGPAVITQIGDGILDGSRGRIEYRWQPGDTTTPGDYWAEFEVTFNDVDGAGTTSVQTFPTVSYIECTIYEDLGGTV